MLIIVDLKMEGVHQLKINLFLRYDFKCQVPGHTSHSHMNHMQKQAPVADHQHTVMGNNKQEL